jgi:tRNA(Arg) A34 adenosine deaminase TadA
MDSHSRKRDKKFLDFLAKAAEAADHGDIRAKLAAAIVISNEIISIGFNRKKTHPFQAQFKDVEQKDFLHAETDAINRALKYVSKDELRKATLYISRVKYISNKNHKIVLAESKPCKGCQKAIISYNIKRVVHTCHDGEYSVM